MATKRIDILFEENDIRVKSEDEFNISYDDYFMELLTYNWRIIINKYDSYIYIESTSNAKTTSNKKFYTKLKEGTLFLYNSTTNWYWYFRDKEIQDFLDSLSIGQVISIPDYRANLTFHQYLLFDPDKEELFTTSLDRKKGSTMQFYSDTGTNIKHTILLSKYNIFPDKNLLDFDLKIELNKFLLVEKIYNGYRKLYIKSSYNLNYVKEYFSSIDKIEFTKLIPNIQDICGGIKNEKINWEKFKRLI